MFKGALAASLFVLGLAAVSLPTSAQALPGFLPGVTGGGEIHQIHFKKKHHKHHKHHKKGLPFVITFGNLFGAHQHGHNHTGGWYPSNHRNCHDVVKNGYVNGRFAKIGATRCYDHHGRAYIVQGSRHVIHFY